MACREAGIPVGPKVTRRNAYFQPIILNACAAHNDARLAILLRADKPGRCPSLIVILYVKSDGPVSADWALDPELRDVDIVASARAKYPLVRAQTVLAVAAITKPHFSKGRGGVCMHRDCLVGGQHSERVAKTTH